MSLPTKEYFTSTHRTNQDLISDNKRLVRENTWQASEGNKNIQSIIESIKKLDSFCKQQKTLTTSSSPLESVESEDFEKISQDMLLHDIRNSVVNIVSLVKLIKQQPLSDSVLRLLDLLEKQSEMIHEQTQFQSIYNQLELRSYQPERVSFDLLQLCHEILRSVHRKHPESPTELWLDNKPAAMYQEFVITSDFVLMKLMLQNLVQNAAEASPAHAPVRVDINRQVIDNANCLEQLAASSNVTISIHNQGAIPIVIQDCFFEKFATHGKPKGTGLGTYIAKLAAQAFGGTIKFSTSEEQGTTLTVQLPKIEGKNSEESR